MSSICAFLIIHHCQLPSLNSLFTHIHHRLMDRSDQTELTIVSYLVFGGVVCSKWQGCKAFSPYELPSVLIGDSRAATSTVLLRLASGRAEVFPQSLSFPVICLSSPGTPTSSPQVFVLGNAQWHTFFFFFFTCPPPGWIFSAWYGLDSLWQYVDLLLKVKGIRKYMCCWKNIVIMCLFCRDNVHNKMLLNHNTVISCHYKHICFSSKRTQN